MSESSHERPVILPARAVRVRYGVSGRTIDRWLTRETLHFPRPLRVNGRKYWREEELIDWELSRPIAVASS